MAIEALETTRSGSRLRQAGVLAGSLALYLLCIGPAGLFWDRPWLLFGLYLGASAVLLLKWHSAADLAYYFVPFVLGPLGELFPVHQGAWSYGGSWLIPAWLPLVWGIAGLFMRRLSESVRDAVSTAG